MAVRDHAVARQTSSAFVDDSFLTYFILSATDFSFEDIQNLSGDSFQAKLSALERREQLFFGIRLAS